MLSFSGDKRILKWRLVELTNNFPQAKDSMDFGLRLKSQILILRHNIFAFRSLSEFCAEVELDKLGRLFVGKESHFAANRPNGLRKCTLQRLARLAQQSAAASRINKNEKK